jgi:peptidoglycan hydrolase CwlO-like protein
MLRLFLKPAIVFIAALSLFPQVSAEFKEEQQGVQAAYEKAVKVYDSVTSVYSETKQEIEVIQTRVTETKEDIDEGVAFAKKTQAEMSKYSEELKALADDAQNVVGAVRAEMDDGSGAEAGQQVSSTPKQ